MGNFVDKLGPTISIPNIQAPQTIHTEGDFDGWKASPYAPIDLVEGRFNDTLATAETMRDKLIGAGGYLDELESIIAEISVPDVTYNGVSIGSDATTSISSPPVSGSTTVPSATLAESTAPSKPSLNDTALSVSLPTAPSFTGTIDTAFPTFDAASPEIQALPSVDMSSLLSASMPEELSAAISWFEEAYDDSLYTPLFNRLIADLQSGASGIGGTVEQEIYDRAQARQNIEEDKQQTEIEEYFSATGFDLPTGAMAARLQEHANGRAMRANDLNSQIMIEQAELAQKNSQFVIEAARGLEGVLRDYASRKNDRSLDYQKAVAANAIAVYAEKVRGYLATLEANRNYVQLQVEHLRAVIEANKGAVSVYVAEAQAYEAEIRAKASKNEAVVSVFNAEIAGYNAKAAAVVDAFKAQVQERDSINSNETALYKADVDKYTSEARANVDAYRAELDGTSAYNATITDTYRSDVAGYEAETRAISENQRNILQAYALKIQNAENELKAATANAENAVSGYGTEYSLRERVSESMANVAMQSMASAYGAVNSSAGISYNGSESQSESWSHNESRSDSYSHSESISNNASISSSVSNSLTESHSYLE